MSIVERARPCGMGRKCLVTCPECADLDFPSRPVTGFFALLTPEQQAAALAYDGPQDFGPDEYRLDAPAYTHVSCPMTILEEDGYMVGCAVASIFATAGKFVAEHAPDWRFAASRPWEEDDFAYQARLMAVNPEVDVVPFGLLDAAGRDLGLPRARLVLVEG